MWIQLNSQLINLDQISNIDIYHTDIPNNSEYTVRFFSSDLSLWYSFSTDSKEKTEEVMNRVTTGIISGLKFLNLDEL